MEYMKSREIKIGQISIGGENRIAVQSMTNTDTKNVEATVNQIRQLTMCGCDIVRCSVYDFDCAEKISEIKKLISIPIVADIHFDYRIAIAAIKNGADKIRINPGNIGSKNNILEIVKVASDYGVPIRVGGNAGSLNSHFAQKYGNVWESLAKSAEHNINILEDTGFENIVVSVKSSDVKTTVRASRYIASKYDYPIHLGVTEAGTIDDSSVKSSIGIGALLLDGIGDTIRVSITGNPVSEIDVANKILRFTGYSSKGPVFVSCPTCARCSLNLEHIVMEMKKYVKSDNKTCSIAIMGCAVNGPGEAKECDFGVAGGHGKAVLFKKGKIYKNISDNEIIAELKQLYDEFTRDEC